MNHKKTVAISIPTGIGAEIGGFAGDGPPQGGLPEQCAGVPHLPGAVQELF